MRANRRLVVIDRIIPFLAAGVGLLALAGSVVVQMNTDVRTAALTTQMAEVRVALEQINQRADALALADDDGTAAGLLALQDRIVELEAELAAQGTAAAASAPLGLRPGSDAVAATPAPGPVDPDLPTTDCIPLGTRFMVTPNETFPLCQSTARVVVGEISGEAVAIEGAGTIVETGFGTLVGTSCTVMVFSADIEGFAELRVTCT